MVAGCVFAGKKRTAGQQQKKEFDFHVVEF
jgi:hypothetical protein